MSVQPNNLCKLKKGKALGAFPTFVDTFNWMVDFCANLIGEADDPAASESGRAGNLRVDRSTSDHPVIRGGGSGGGVKSSEGFSFITDISLRGDGVYVKTRSVNVDTNGMVTDFGSESDWTKKINTTPHSEI